jgi:molybdate transport system regulatory protein
LLEAIREAGSLSQAARDLGMSYRRAWLLVDSFKAAFREPVTTSTTGGKRGGGVALTRFGEELIAIYRDLEREIAELAARRLRGITPAVASRGTPPQETTAAPSGSGLASVDRPRDAGHERRRVAG